MSKNFNSAPSAETINQTISALEGNGFSVSFVEDLETAKAKALELIPEGSEVMTYTSATLDTAGISTELNESGKYLPNRDKLYSLNRETEGKQMRILGSTADYSIGSVQAITTNGELITASATGSQLPGQAFSSGTMIVVAGVQKIVDDISQGMERIEQYVLPLESERAKIAYGVPGSSINKILIMKKEVNPGRVHIILVNQSVGY